MRHHFLWAALVALTGCGSSGSSMTSAGNNPSGGNPNPPTGNVSAPVSITGYAFSPSSVMVKAGSSVTWTNNDPVQHTTTSDAGTWNSGQLSAASGGAYGGTSAGGSYSHTFSSAGTFAYHCANHSYMTGTVTVTP